MGTRVPIILNVRGDLDTSMPVTDRPPGTLVRARDVHPRRWGPRTGGQSFARAWEGPGTASLYDEITLTTGASTYGQGISFEEQFRQLGTQFTLDVWFRLSDLAYAAGIDTIGLYKFRPDAGVIDVWINGPNVANHERISVNVATSGTSSSATVVSSTRITAGTTQADKQHLRVVRDGALLYLYLNGVLEATGTTLNATAGVAGTVGNAATVTLGTGFAALGPSVASLKGTIYGAWLRDGAFTSEPIEAVMPCDPHARNVHHAYLGRNISLGGVDHYFDASRYGAHARIIGAGYSVTASNDDAAPAPATVQGLATWTTRTNRTATSVVCGGLVSTAGET